MTKTQELKLQQLITEDSYEALLKLKEEVKLELEKQIPIGKDEFETMKLTFQKEYSKQALDDFFKRIESYARTAKQSNTY